MSEEVDGVGEEEIPQRSMYIHSWRPLLNMSVRFASNAKVSGFPEYHFQIDGILPNVHKHRIKAKSMKYWLNAQCSFS
jgi:hypothetical protein